MAPVGIITHDVYLAHRTGLGHPERPERLMAIARRLKDTGLWEPLVPIVARMADESDVAMVHDPDYIEAAAADIRQGRALLSTGDTMICSDSLDAALTAVGGAMAACDAVMAGQVARAFCAIRPPGHHATPDGGMGFCIFNNIAVAARYLQRTHGVRKILIVDWDVHHGNGTQDAFYGDPDVLFFSVHQSPMYPGTGAEGEIGIGPGIGATINVPLPAGCDDEVYVRAFRERLLSAATRFGPEVVLISAGFDAHEDDPIGGMHVSAGGFAGLTKIVCDIADECSGGKIVSLLEGGYGLTGLADSVEAHVRAMM